MTSSTLGRYTLIRKLATGGMAEVFLARADGPGGFAKRLVVKRILPHLVEDQRFVSMFLSEANLAAQLNHPNLVQIFDFGETGGQYFLAMEFIDGPNLRMLAQRAREFGQPLSLPICARIISQAAEGLKYAHDLKDEQGNVVNLVHRDISPDNILVSRSGTVKVVDFGIAKTNVQMHHTKSGVIKGKMAYMPPEQLNRQMLDRRTDVYALGVVLYELICGEFPFDATSEVSIIQAIMNQEPLMPISQRMPSVPRDLEAIITKCLSKDREQRFADCAELQRALEKFIQSSQATIVPADIAATVDSFFPARPEGDATENSISKIPTDEAFAPTFSKGSDQIEAIRKSGGNLAHGQQRQAPEPGVDKTDMSMKAAGLKPSRAPLVIGVVAVISVVAGIALWPKADPVKTVSTPAVIDSGIAVAVVVPPVIEQIVDAGHEVVAAAEVDAGAAMVEAPVVSDAGTKVVSALPAVRRAVPFEIRCKPSCQVFVDDKRLGEADMSFNGSVVTGVHRLRLKSSDGREFSKQIEVPASGFLLKKLFDE